MTNQVKAAAALINECKAKGFYTKPMPDADGIIIQVAEDLYTKAKASVESGNTKEDVKAIVRLGEAMESHTKSDDPDDTRFNDLVMNEIQGLPNPSEPDFNEEMPYNLETLNAKNIMRYMGVFNSYYGYANHMYSLEEAASSAAKIIADEAYDEWLVTASKKDEETKKPKTARQLEAEANVEDERVKKWRDKQKEHAVRAKRYKRLKDIYFENCERLSRAFSALQEERKYTNG
jgi:hypothetical protein